MAPALSGAFLFCGLVADVRFGSEADVTPAYYDVCFTRECGHPSLLQGNPIRPRICEAFRIVTSGCSRPDSALGHVTRR